MRIYTNGVNLSINDAVRIDFKDSINGETDTVTSVAMGFDTFKMITEAFTKAINEHEEKLEQLKKAN